MGYTTNYYGQIYLSDKKAIKIIKKMIKEEEEPFEDYDIDINDDNEKYVHLNISCSWKDYDDWMMKLCYFVAMLDKSSYGEIECRGEENDDIWRIRILEDGVVLQEFATITYDEGSEFKDKDTMKQIYTKTKDKQLLKEIMVDSL